tara:strand:+ start:473 stop:730 length:258 start_codon:yes stop_codon:yes gene_type:complete
VVDWLKLAVDLVTFYVGVIIVASLVAAIIVQLLLCLGALGAHAYELCLIFAAATYVYMALVNKVVLVMKRVHTHATRRLHANAAR